MRQGKLINIRNSKSALNHTASVHLPKARVCTLSLEFISQIQLYYNNILILLQNICNKYFCLKSSQCVTTLSHFTMVSERLRYFFILQFATIFPDPFFFFIATCLLPSCGTNRVYFQRFLSPQVCFLNLVFLKFQRRETTNILHS